MHLLQVLELLIWAGEIRQEETFHNKGNTFLKMLTRNHSQRVFHEPLVRSLSDLFYIRCHLMALLIRDNKINFHDVEESRF